MNSASMSSSSSDLDKLFQSLQELSFMFGSLENMLDAFGLLHMPTAQRYGILFGFVTFVVTLITVACLLIWGGSFQRMAQQQQGDATIVHAHLARSERALLYEHLLDARQELMKHYPPPLMVTQGFSALTKLLLNQHGTVVDGKKVFPQGYQSNYETAYRHCQDSPGGAALTGRPEARYEAYARAFAGAGTATNVNYRRSHARVYEAIVCESHATEETYTQLFQQRPQDVLGKCVRLEALEASRHADALFDLTSGQADLEGISYDPEEIWGFLPEGPFGNKQEMAKSFVFQRQINEAGFAIINNITNKLMGAVLLTNDQPANLSIQLEAPIMRPALDGSTEQLEACFLLLDKLFALGYRRIQMSLDHQDGPGRKLALRLGFTLEGTLYKHLIVKDSSRDSVVYGLLNSDWDKGARFALFKKLYGVAAARADVQRRLKAEEADEQQRVLAEQKAAAAEAAATTTSDKDKNL